MSEYFEYHITSKQTNSTASAAAAAAAISKLTTNDNRNYNSEIDQRKSLEELRNLILSSTNLIMRDKSFYNDDEFLRRFLYAKKFNSIDSFNLILNYQKYKQTNFILLKDINIFDNGIKAATRDGFPLILKERDRKGRKIIVFYAGNWDSSLYTLDDIYRSLLLTLDRLLDDKVSQSQGFIIIIDWTNFTMKQSAYLSPKTLKIMFEGLQDCLPIKFKAIHFLSQPWYVDIIVNMLKPFLNEKSRKRLKFHGQNLSSLHSFIPKDVLPTELGGEGETINALDWYHTLLESSQTNDSNKIYTLTKSTVYSKA